MKKILIILVALGFVLTSNYTHCQTAGGVGGQSGAIGRDRAPLPPPPPSLQEKISKMAREGQLHISRAEKLEKDAMAMYQKPKLKMDACKNWKSASSEFQRAQGVFHRLSQRYPKHPQNGTWQQIIKDSETRQRTLKGYIQQNKCP